MQMSVLKTFETLKSNLLKLDTLLQTTKPKLLLIQEKNETFSSGRFGLVIWSEVSSFKKLDFNVLNVFQN